MRNKIYIVIVWAALVALLLISIPSAIRLGPETLGKKFVDSDQFQSELSIFYDTLSTSVLNSIDFEEAKDKLIVTDEEIEEHRMRYGTLSDQILNIQEQYEYQIVEAEEMENERMKEMLIKERDAKIEDIEQNFESDEHVEQKVLAEKTATLKRYIDEIKQPSSHFPMAYELTDVKTGEVFTKGDIDAPAVYKREFGGNNDYFQAKSIIDDYYYDSDIVYDYDGYTLTVADIANIQNPNRQFEGTVIVSEKALAGSYLQGNKENFEKTKYRNYTLWILAILAIYPLSKFVRIQGDWFTENRFAKYYDRLKIDSKVIIFVVILFFSVEIILNMASTVFFYDYFYIGAWRRQLYFFVQLMAAVLVFTFQVVNCFKRWRQPSVFEQDARDSYTVQLIKAIQVMFLNRTLGVQMFILLIGFFLAGIGFALTAVEPMLVLAYLPAVLFLGLPALYIFMRRAAYLNHILHSTEKMANGTLFEEIKVEGKSPLAKHASHLNRLREGVETSISEQAKSERLKTELITNVSHDLRTPLTSIITYTDLLKTKKLTEEERLKYVDILDKKSARLKTLIEDLFEVSKMASGNLELHKQKVDLTQLLQQALAEHAEDISISTLDFRVQMPESPIIANIDGQRWWRVLDNLIVNALKYSMPGTRVYINLDCVGNHAQFVVKNISKYELSEDSDELFERFKRADTSRHTDGSGLGLAIAESIIGMHGGEMQIDVDGDLFKVTVKIPVEL